MQPKTSFGQSRLGRLLLTSALVFSLCASIFPAVVPVAATAASQPSTNGSSVANSPAPTTPPRPVDKLWPGQSHRQEADNWFYSQRAGADGTIPAGAWLRATEQRDKVPAFTPVQSDAVGPRVTGWQQIGAAPTVPINVNVYTGPFGNSTGRINAMAYDSVNNIVYAGSAPGGGVWKSSDNGANWTPLTDDQPSLVIGAITLDPTNPQIIYVGTGEANFNGDAYYGAGILKSTNGGASWTTIGASTFGGKYVTGRFVGVHISKIAIDPNSAANNRTIFVASDAGLYQSTDNGATFNLKLGYASVTTATPSYINDVIVDSSTNPSTVYAAWGYAVVSTRGIYNGFYRSTDGGNTWPSPAANGQPGAVGVPPAPTGTGYPTGNSGTNPPGRMSLSYFPPNATLTNGKLYMLLANANDQSSLGVWSSLDRGSTWTQVTQACNYNANAGCLSGPDLLGGDKPGAGEQGFYDIYVKADPSDATGNTIYVGGVNLWKSTTGGVNFTDITNVYTTLSFTPHPDQHDLVFYGNASPRAFFMGNDGGVYASTNGGTSFTDNNGTGAGALAITEYYGGSTTANFVTNPIIYSGTQDNGNQKYNGVLTWTQPYGGDGGFTATDPNNPNISYEEYVHLRISKTTDGGATWTQTTNGLSVPDPIDGSSGDNISGALFIAPFIMDRANANHLLAGSSLVNETKNGAANWVPISPAFGGSISALAIAPSDNTKTYYAGTSTGKVEVTTNGGTNWTDISAGTAGALGRYVTFFAVNPNNSQDVVVSFSGFNSDNGTTSGKHIYRSTNGGTSWSDISLFLPDAPVNSVLFDPTKPDTVYAGGDVGFYFTTNGGTSWLQFQTGLPNVPIQQLYTDSAFTTILAATHGRSTYALSTALIGGGGAATLTVAPSSLIFNATQGGSAPPSQVVTLTANGAITYSSTISYSANSGAATWLNLNPASGFISSTSVPVTVAASQVGLAAGTYTATVTFKDTANMGTFTTLNVTLTVTAAPVLSAAPTALSFASQVGSNPASQTVTLTASNGPITYTTSYSGALTVTASPASGTVASGGNSPVTISVNATGLAAGTYTATVTFQDTTNPADKATVNVTLIVTAAPPTVYTYYLPFLANGYNPGAPITGTFTSYLAVENAGSGTANATISYFDSTGVTLTSSTVVTTIAQYGEILPANPFASGAKGAGVITSNQPLNVIVAEGTPYGGSAYAVNQGANSSLIVPLAINNNNNFVTQITVFNGGTVTTTATLTYYDQSGASPTNQVLTVGPRQSATADQTNVTGLASGFYGWAAISSTVGSQLVAQVLEQRPDIKFVAIANAQPAPQTTLYAPAIFNNAYGGFFTGANIVNPASTPVTVSISYYDQGGTRFAATPFVLVGRGVQQVFQGSATGNGIPAGGLPANFVGAAVITSTGGGVNMVVNEVKPVLTGSQSGVYAAASSGSSNLGLPVIAKNGFGYTTGTTVFNASPISATFTLTYYKLDGTALTTPAPRNITVAAHASVGVYQGDDLPSDFYGTAVLVQTSGGSTLIDTTNAINGGAGLFYTYTEPAQ